MEGSISFLNPWREIGVLQQHMHIYDDQDNAIDKLTLHIYTMHISDWYKIRAK